MDVSSLVRNDATVSLNDAEKTLAWVLGHMASRPPDFTIGSREDPQLERWYAVPRNPIRNVYLHRFIRSDDDRALHDHPWSDNVSWVLSGDYVEHLLDGKIELRRAGDVVRRHGPSPHRIELRTAEPVITMFFTGPIVREWGFLCPQGWRSWKEFVSTYPGGNAMGRGCE